ncbi:uncharacterized protein LOC143300510 [Babylonia areolata]|uniref:uncharacterized protein LOC143300510 n=1 Tax=Babylonia areolata TaxID=304850 RepID=UPI003FD08277
MYNLKRVTRRVCMAVLVVIGLLFIPPLRNILTLGFIPRLWRDESTFRLIKSYMSGYSCSSPPEAALSPCTLPARATDSVPGHRDLMQQLLNSEPFKQTWPRPQDEEAHSTAWTWLRKQSPERRESLLPFAPKLSPVEKGQMVRTWRVLHEAMTLHNITHFLIDGTLLGAVRHGGVTPWDDEMDVAVDVKDMDKLQRVLSCIPGFSLFVQPCRFWKFFSDHAPVIPMFSQSPHRKARVLEEEEKEDYVLQFHPFKDVVVRAFFVDIFFVTTDDTHVWCLTQFNQKSCLYPIEDVYPLTRMKFEGELAPVPRHSAYLMRRTYDANVCVSSENDHVKGSDISDVREVPCEELADMHNVYVV